MAIYVYKWNWKFIQSRFKFISPAIMDSVILFQSISISQWQQISRAKFQIRHHANRYFFNLLASTSIRSFVLYLSRQLKTIDSLQTFDTNRTWIETARDRSSFPLNLSGCSYCSYRTMTPKCTITPENFALDSQSAKISRCLIKSNIVTYDRTCY